MIGVLPFIPIAKADLSDKDEDMSKTGRQAGEDIKGVCYLVGAGPGDPGLATIRARALIAEADVIFYDYLSNPALLSWAREEAEIIYVGKKAGEHTLPQSEINQAIVERTRQGLRVVRLKGGDPFVFGRGGEEAQALRAAGVPFEVVPGVTSAVAGPAYAGIPVTHREHCSQLTILTGHEDPTKEATSLDYARLAATPGTKVLLMGVERIRTISSELLRHGMPPGTPVALVRWATTGRQQTLSSTLGFVADDVEQTGFQPPAVVILGDVAGLRDELAWFEKRRPLLGQRIVVTRTRKKAGQLAETLRALGADAIELPVIRIEPPTDQRALEEAVTDAHTYDWLVFTSSNGVDAFFEKFYAKFDDARSLGGVRIAAIGPATAERVRHYRFAVDLLPKSFVAEEVAREFAAQGGVEHLKLLLPRAEAARDVLPEELEAMGGIVDCVTAYRTVAAPPPPPHVLRQLEDGADWVTFTSSSTVENFLALGLPWPEGARAASIGPVTSATLRKHNIEPAIEALRHDIPGLVEALLSACNTASCSSD